jgi:translation initiation factor 3 subunit A
MDVLHEILKSRRHRNWVPALEKIAKKYLEICVELRYSRQAKDGLIQYRMSCQAVNIGSLEDVIKHFLTLSEKKATDAQEMMGDETLASIVNLDAGETPRDVMLAAFTDIDSGEAAKKGQGKPWLIFLWETYRTVLDILKNNSKLEVLYQDVAKRGFKFCQKYKRGTELVKMCETLRSHLANLSRNQFRKEQSNRTIQMSDLSNPDTVQLFLDTRFEQLAVAMELEQWQEAYRCVEDIHGLMSFSKKAPKPHMQAAYFRALTRIFFVSGAYLFHAYAWQKLYVLTKNQKKDVSTEELQTMASCVLLAALCIPQESDLGAPTGLLAYETGKDKDLRMAQLLGFSTKPTRSSLIADLASKNIVSQAREELRTVYQIMEKDFLPRQMMPTLGPVIAYLESTAEQGDEGGEGGSLVQYVQPLQRVAVKRMLMQLSQVYKVMTIRELQKLCAPIPFPEVEMLIVEGMRAQLFSVRIDHLHGCVNFERQTFGSDEVQDMLGGLAVRLSKTMELLRPSQDTAQASHNKQEVYAEILANVHQEQKRILSRKKVIEDRKETEEQIAAEEEAEEARNRSLQAAAREQKEKERMEEEARQRARQVEQEAEREDEMRRKKVMIAELIASDPDNCGDLKGLTEEEVAALDLTSVQRKRDKAAEKERNEAEKKLAQMQRRLDHFERAKRLQEIPLLEEMYEAQKQDDEEFWKKNRAVELKEHRERYEKDIAEKDRLLRMRSQQEEYLARVTAEVEERYAEYRVATEQRIEDRRREKKEAAEKAAREKEREERRLMDEVREAQEEAQRREEEERERRRRDEEERMMREREAMSMQRGPSDGAYRPGGMRGGGGGGDGAYRPGGMRGGGMGGGGGGGDGAYRPGGMRGGGMGAPPQRQGFDGPGPGRYAPPGRRDSGGAPPPSQDGRFQSRGPPRGGGGGGGGGGAPADGRFQSSGTGYRPPGAR